MAKQIKKPSAVTQAAMAIAPTPAPPSHVKLVSRDGTTQTVLLVPPVSFAVRFEVWLLANQNRPRAYAAALGLCGLAGPKNRLRYTGDPMVFGGEVIDHLVDLGVPYASILGAGLVAYELLSDGLSEMVAEVAEAEVFTGQPGGSSTG